MSKEYKSIMQGLKEAVNDAKGNIDLPRKTVEFSNTVRSQDALKDIVPINRDLTDWKRKKSNNTK